MGKRRPLLRVQGLLYIIMTLVPTSEMYRRSGDVSGASTSVSCPQHFGHQVTRCLEPYWAVAAIFNSGRSAAGSFSVALAKHLCLQFEIALVCLHTELTKCPTVSNIEFIQSKLGSDWAVAIRNLCVGQSNPSTHEAPQEDLSHPERIIEASNGPEEHYSPERDEDYVTGDNNDVMGVRSKKIIVLVPGDDRFRHDIVVAVRNRVKLQPRHHHRHHRLHEQPLDIKVFNSFEERHNYLPANGAAAKISALTVLLTVVVTIAFSWS